MSERVQRKTAGWLITGHHPCTLALLIVNLFLLQQTICNNFTFHTTTSQSGIFVLRQIFFGDTFLCPRWIRRSSSIIWIYSEDQRKPSLFRSTLRCYTISEKCLFWRQYRSVCSFLELDLIWELYFLVIIIYTIYAVCDRITDVKWYQPHMWDCSDWLTSVLCSTATDADHLG